MKYFLLFLIFSLTQCKVKNSILIGTWVNKDDKNSVLKLDKINFSEVYENKLISSSHYKYSIYSCDTTYLKVKIKGTTFLKLETGECYEVTNLTDSVLTLRYTNTGSLLQYFKKN